MNTAKPILEEYGEFLEKQGIDFRTLNCFSVCLELVNAAVTFIKVRVKGNIVTLFNYFGTCYTGIRATNRVVKVLKGKFPKYTIWVEKFTTFEIDIEEIFQFFTIGHLHERVCRMAAVIDERAGIGKEMLGESFDR